MPGEKKQNADGATYTVLAEHDLAAELTRHAQAQTIRTTDVVSIQPCPTPAERSQDRFVVADWLISDQTWRFQAVLDGHAGHETVDHVVTILPDIVRNALVAAFVTEGQPDVGELLRKAIADLDEQISQAMLDLFPGGPDALANISNEEVAFLINDGGVNSVKILRCMRGCTVLVALVGPDLDIWVASLGDSQCVLGTRTPPGEWETRVLSSNHNGADTSEAARIRSEHPGEDECILNDRVLGSIAITRAAGDFLFKLPAIYTTRVFLNSNPGFRFSHKVADFLPRNLTPPYLSAQSEIQHVHVPSLGATDVFLVLASDGLVDLSGDTYGMDYREPAVGGRKWVEVLSRGDRAKTDNAALYLLRDAMGGDTDKVSSLLTVESEARWIDDTTVLFTKLV